MRLLIAMRRPFPDGAETAVSGYIFPVFRVLITCCFWCNVSHMKWRERDYRKCVIIAIFSQLVGQSMILFHQCPCPPARNLGSRVYFKKNNTQIELDFYHFPCIQQFCLWIFPFSCSGFFFLFFKGTLLSEWTSYTNTQDKLNKNTREIDKR